VRLQRHLRSKSTSILEIQGTARHLLATTVPATAHDPVHTIAAREATETTAIGRADTVHGMDASLGAPCRMVAASRIADISARFLSQLLSAELSPKIDYDATGAASAMARRPIVNSILTSSSDSLSEN
jgi:hypothetical protein